MPFTPAPASRARRIGPRGLSALAVLLVFAGRAPSAAAQCETFGPTATGFRSSQSQFYDQIWSQIARGTNGGYVAVWSEGQDIALRRFDANWNPTSNDTLVNATLNLEVQDEPSIGVATGGNQLVAWSERHGYDGELMGIYGRLYGASGTALGTEFRVNQITAASQWRPLVAPTPAGGFVVAWSGNWDGDAFLRVFSSTGTPLTNDVLINQYTFDAQVDPAVAAAPNGNLFATFVDFSSHATVGSGLDLYGRVFQSNGTALTNEFLVTSVPFTDGDQRLPRVGVDANGRFLVVWMSEQVDGSGYGIVARRFDSAGVALSPEFTVNTVTTGDQREPRLAVESDGDFVVSWEDWSTGVSRLKFRRYDAALAPKGSEAVLQGTGPGAYLPEVIVSPAGDVTVFAYDAWNGADTDVFVRAYAAANGPQVVGAGKLNSAGCIPTIATSGTPTFGGAGAFTISASNVLSQSPGLLVYGFGTNFTAFQGGTLYVPAPMRMPLQVSGGTGAGNCSGTFAVDFNARIHSGADPLLVPGATVTAQYYYRDPADPAGFASGLSNAVRFTICP